MTARARLALAAPIVVALAVRALLAWDASDAPLLGDEATLQRFGRIWHRYGVYVGEWPPAYPWLLATLHGLFGEPANLAWARGFNVLCSTLVVGATMGLSHQMGGRRAALLAGWLAALSPGPAIWAALLYTEALFVLVFTTALWVAVRHLRAEQPSRAAPFVIGALLGLGTWVRAAGLILLVAVAFGVAAARLASGTGRVDGAAGSGRAASAAGRRRTGALRAAAEGLAVLTAGLAVLAPLVVRGTLETGAPKWASGTGAANMALGWSGARIPFERVGIADEAVHAAPLGGLRRWLEAPGPAVPGLEVLVPGVGMGTYAPARMREVLLEHPGWALRSRIVHVGELLSPLSFAHRAVRTGQLDGLARHPLPRRLFTVGGVVLAVLALALAVVGVARGTFAPAVGWLAAAVAAAHLVVPLLMFGISRFRAPLEPLIFVFAALALGPGGARRRPRVAVGLAAFVAAALAVSAPVVVAALRASW